MFFDKNRPKLVGTGEADCTNVKNEVLESRDFFNCSCFLMRNSSTNRICLIHYPPQFAMRFRLARLKEEVLSKLKPIWKKASEFDKEIGEKELVIIKMNTPNNVMQKLNNHGFSNEYKSEINKFLVDEEIWFYEQLRDKVTLSNVKVVAVRELVKGNSRFNVCCKSDEVTISDEKSPNIHFTEKNFFTDANMPGVYVIKENNEYDLMDTEKTEFQC